MSNFDQARRAYLSQGPELDMREMDHNSLQVVSGLLASDPHPDGQEMRGWASLETMFLHPNNEFHRFEAYDAAEASFTAAYSGLDQEDDVYRMFRLVPVAAALPIYERMAANEPISDEECQLYLGKLAACLKELQAISPDDLRESDVAKVETLKYETAVLLALQSRRGDSRKPMASLAVPATIRQRIAHLPGGVERVSGRMNWGISLYGWGNEWRRTNRIHVVSQADKNEKTPLDARIAQLNPEFHLLNLQAVDPAGFTIRALVKYQEKGRADKEARQEALAAHSRVSQYLRNHKETLAAG